MNVREDFNDDLLMPSKKERRARTKNSALKKFYKEYGAFAFATERENGRVLAARK